MNFVKNYSLKISTLVSYDNDWAAFLIRKIKPEDLHRQSIDLKRYYPFIDFEKRIVIPPDDFLKELKKNKKAFERFNKLSLLTRKNIFNQFSMRKNLKQD